VQGRENDSGSDSNPAFDEAKIEEVDEPFNFVLTSHPPETAHDRFRPRRGSAFRKF
jgi:hypothetical protein